MRNPRPVCPNTACQHHRNPPADFYRKHGTYRPRHNHQPVPRYQCRACGKTFSATQTKPIAQQHRPALNRQIFQLAVSGATMRRMATLLECSPQTVQAKVEYLAAEAKRLHQERMEALWQADGTGHVMMDELETFIHARWAQVSVAVVVRACTGEVLGFTISRLSSTMPKGKANGWTTDTRARHVPRLLTSLAPYLKPGARFTTDGDASYGKWIRANLPGIQHVRSHSPKKDPHAFDPLFQINLIHAKMRNDLARLSRKTWTTSKTIEGLRNHVWLWVAWINGYRLR
ncbi:hypothetical protein [Thauera sp. Sel9]|uniref:hypothetical protein n=1 Tax=Thauera sp. Sel9 TaxID=2974299 RepID=UPI0021E1A378|nr:hypothetical protein [Thauera sp. Sel9]MCV2216112.1 hypothetical protein [Thauera sp. Sel9]